MTAKKATATTKKAAETAVASDPVKTAEPVKAEKPAETKAEPVKAEPAKKTAAKKTTAKKTTAAKTTAAKKATTKKAAAKKAEIKTEMYLQFAGKEYSQEEILQKVKDIWTYDLNQNVDDIKDVQLYLKPEESAAYYVVNGVESGKVIL